MHTVKEEGANGSLNFKKTGRFLKFLINSIAFIIKEFLDTVFTNLFSVHGRGRTHQYCWSIVILTFGNEHRSVGEAINYANKPIK